MITDFNDLRKHIEPPARLGRSTGQSVPEMEYTFKLEYARTMALIQIAQELNEIKNIISTDGEGFIRTKLTVGPQ